MLKRFRREKISAAAPPIWLCALLLTVFSRLVLFALYLIWKQKYGVEIGIFDALHRYDCGWYEAIAQYGYRGETAIHEGGGQAAWAFFPLVPLLQGAASALSGLPPRVTGVLLNTVFLFLLTWAAGAYGMLVGKTRRVAVLLMLLFNFGPYNVYYSTLYTEVLFALLVCLFCYCMRKKWWLRMGLCGALAGATRNMGIFLAFVVLVACIQNYLSGKEEQAVGHKSLIGFARYVLVQPKLVLGVCLIPMGFFAYMAYLQSLLGDGMAFAHVEIGWEKTAGNPAAVLLSALNTLGAHEFYYALWALAGAYLCCRQAIKRRPEAVASVLFVMIPLSTSVFSMPRYVACSFPLVFEAADCLKEKGKLEKFFWYGFLLLLGAVTSWQWLCNNPVMA